MVSINLKFPLKSSSDGFATNTTTIDAIEDDLRMLLLTNHGERLIHGDFGANLRKIIFEFQGSQLYQAIQDSIIIAVEKWMPFVILDKITVTDSINDNSLRPNEINIKIEYSVGQGINGVLNQQIRV